ncbi:hypothetical protein ANCCAN_05314 [Ancylostoma caninum]|uniref:Uncharacterized protein n=1 Tax=Ancylostoma caninum TaxID=29170 RepID=A0A368GWC6_ANCCA|nr:hypothetical protein ANCCAN_05314 [Ancylostoma caninum]
MKYLLVFLLFIAVVDPSFYIADVCEQMNSRLLKGIAKARCKSACKELHCKRSVCVKLPETGEKKCECSVCYVNKQQQVKRKKG